MDERNGEIRIQCETCRLYDAVLDRCQNHMSVSDAGRFCKSWRPDDSLKKVQMWRLKNTQ